MVLYKCQYCDKKFKKKSNFNDHLNRKIKCYEKNTIIIHNNNGNNINSSVSSVSSVSAEKSRNSSEKLEEYLNSAEKSRKTSINLEEYLNPAEKSRKTSKKSAKYLNSAEKNGITLKKTAEYLILTEKSRNSSEKSNKYLNSAEKSQKNPILSDYLITAELSKNIDNCKCQYCKKIFSSKSNVIKHIKYGNCKIIQKYENDKKNIFENLINQLSNKHNNEIMELKEQNKQLTDIVMELKENSKLNLSNIITNNTINNVKNNNIINQQNNNINLIGYGKEDKNKLTSDQYIKILSKGYSATLEMTELLHFNKDMPEYHNVYISSMKEKYGMIFDGTTWNLISKDELVENIYYDKIGIIDEKFEEFYDKLSKSKKDALERWFNDNNCDNKNIDKIKDKIKLLLYNKRHIPIATRKIIE
jgi:hypothetical protein